MGLKALFGVGIVIFLPACSQVKVIDQSEKLMPIPLKETVKITLIQVKTPVKNNVIAISKKIVHVTSPRYHHVVQKNQKRVRRIELKKPSKKKTIYFQEGKASYYSSKLHGRKTASGEIYNKNKLTAAHKHLPFGTKVRVLNKDNGRSVLVSINDRGPFVKRRILDLSYVAAKRLGMLRAGVSNIKMEIIQ